METLKKIDNFSENIHVTNERGKLQCIMHVRSLQIKAWEPTAYFGK